MKFQQFQIPKKFFDKLYEFTGSEESSRGFICAYLKQDGDPVVCLQTANPVIELALKRALEEFLRRQDGLMEDVDVDQEG